MTLLSTVYDAFFSLITDDMYLEISQEDTKKDCRGLLNASIPLFEFPTRIFSITDAINDDEEDVSYFNQDLTLEEINIIAMGMVQIWIQRQMTSIEVTRQKFTGADFKQTSQASHLKQLMVLREHVRDEHRRLQMLHSRRELSGGKYQSTFWKLTRM